MSPKGSAPDPEALHGDMWCSSTEKVDTQLWGVIWDAPKIALYQVYESPLGEERFEAVLGSQIGFLAAKSTVERLQEKAWANKLDMLRNKLNNFREDSMGRNREIKLEGTCKVF